MQKRRLRNILIEPFKQIKIGINFIILNMLFGVISAGAFYYFIHDYYQVVFNMFKLIKLPPEMSMALAKQANNIQFSAIVILATVCLTFILITFLFVLRWTHRMYGPISSINKQLEKAIQDQDIAWIELRKNDEFQETARLVNLLLNQTEKVKSSTEQTELSQFKKHG